MVMNTEQEGRVKEFVDKYEETEWLWPLADVVENLTWLKENAESWQENGPLSKWLKNNETMLAYAELSMKTEKLKFWESIKKKLLELKLSITCPYFEDFKEFLEELKRWPDTSKPENLSSGESAWTSTETTAESIEMSARTFCWTKITGIKSRPYHETYNNKGKKVTRCSQTARYNWYHFWISLPRWDAYDAWKNPWQDSIQTIPKDKTDKRPKESWKWIDISEFKSINTWNYADIYTYSKSEYGHRASAFRDDNWQWFVLDPYIRVNWKLDTSPKKLEDYLSVIKIVKAHIYESKWYEENISLQNQNYD